MGIICSRSELNGFEKGDIYGCFELLGLLFVGFARISTDSYHFASSFSEGVREAWFGWHATKSTLVNLPLSISNLTFRPGCARLITLPCYSFLVVQLVEKCARLSLLVDTLYSKRGVTDG